MNENRWFHRVTALTNGDALVTGGIGGGNGGLIYTGGESAELFEPHLGANGGFTPTRGGLITPRQSHTSTRLPDGNVLIAGGQDQYNNPLAQAELFHRDTLDFTSLPDMNSAGDGNAAILLKDGTVLLVGSGAEIYSASPSPHFTSVPVPSGFNGSTVVGLPDNRILILSNFNGWIYNPSTGTISAVPGSMSMVRCGLTATLLQTGKVLIAGGISSCSPTSGWPTASAEIFDPSSNSFTGQIVPQMSTARRAAIAFPLYDGTVLIAGGIADAHGYQQLQSAELYNPSNNTFTSTASMPYAGSYAAGDTLVNGSVLVTGGFNGMNNAAIYSYPFTYSGISPKFVIMDLVYAVPGSQSTVSYANTATAGTTTTLTQTNSSNGGTSFNAGVSFTVAPKQKQPVAKDTSAQSDADKKANPPITVGSVTPGDSNSWTQGSEETSSLALSSTQVTGIGAKGPLSNTIGVDHDFDYFLIWVNPRMQIAQGSTPQDIISGGYQYDPADVNSNEVDYVQIYVSCLKDFYSTESNCTISKDRLQRQWDAQGQGALTEADYATILAQDPFVGNPSFNPATDTSGRYDYYDFINYVTSPAGAGASFASGSWAASTTSKAGQTTTSSYDVGVSFDASIPAPVKADFKYSDKITITNKWSTANDYTSGQSASYQVYSPLYTDQYTGPDHFDVYKDNLYGTYMFYSANTALPSPGSITLTPASANLSDNVPVGSTQFIQMTVTYATAPSTTRNTVNVTFDTTEISSNSPAYTVVPGSDQCAGQSLPLHGSCTFTVQFKPVPGNVTVPGVSSVAGRITVVGTTNAIVRATSTITDTAVPGPPSHGMISVSGAEQSTTGDTYATGTISVSGFDHKHTICIGDPDSAATVSNSTASRSTVSPNAQLPPPKCQLVWDSGDLLTTIGSFTADIYFDSSSTAASLAQDLTTALNATNSPVTAVLNGTDVIFTSKIADAAGNYQVTADHGGIDFKLTPSGPAMSGGVDPSDQGGTLMQINGVIFPAYWNSTSTPTSIAAQIADSINGGPLGNMLVATVSGAVVNLESTALGVPTTNWPIVTVSTTDNSGYPAPSFTFQTTDMTGGTN